MKRGIFCILFFLGLFWSCRPIPKIKHQQFSRKTSFEFRQDSLVLYLENPLHCPTRNYAGTKDSLIYSKLQEHFPFVLSPKSDTTLVILFDHPVKEAKVEFGSTFGDPAVAIDSPRISLPFPKGRTYKIIQGYNGSFSHQGTFSRYAIDFNMKIGDSVSVADSGYVIGVIDQYKYGGASRKWRDYANFITVFHPHSNIYTQYVHLKHQGSFVKVGDYVAQGQVIGLSGLTGFTSIEHLHFNVLRPAEKGMVSMPIDFVEGFQGFKLKKGVQVQKK